MDIERELLRVLAQAEDEVKRLLKEQDDYEAMEACLRVARQLDRVRNSVAMPDNSTIVREQRSLFQRSAHMSYRNESPDPGFRYIVKGNELLRIGRRPGKEADYLQSVDERTFREIVETAARQMQSGEFRLRATGVHKPLSHLPYYQVNLTISFLRDAGILDQAQNDPNSLVDLANRAWEAHRDPI